MKKQNYMSAIIMVLISIVSFGYGYDVSTDDRRELFESYVDLKKTELKNMERNAWRYFNALEALQEGDKENSIELFTLLTMSSLQGIEFEVSEFLGTKHVVIFKPDEVLLRKAREYQSKYCEGECLGI